MMKMKKTLIILIALLPVSLFAQGAKQLAAEADSLYRTGEYQRAAETYEAVIATDSVNADLYYNLGNSYYRLNQMGLAILNYERALRLSPSMADAEENLALANSHTADRITKLPRLFIVRWIDSLVQQLPSTWRVVSLILFTLLCAAVVIFVLSSSLGWRKGSFTAIIISAVLLIGSLLLLFASSHRFNTRADAIIMQPSVSVKSSPEQQSVDKLILHEGTKVTITESLSGWEKITLADGTTGWCEISMIERI